MNFKYLTSGSFIIYMVIAIITSACSLLGINANWKNPAKAGKYPVFTEKDSLRGFTNRFRRCYDVKYYVINLDVDIDEKILKGSVNIQFEAKNNIDTLQIDLYPNMKITNILYNGQNLNYFRKFDAVFILFNKLIKAGEAANITVFYEGKPKVAKDPPWDGGFVWKRDKNKKPWVGVACENDGACLWWPVKDLLIDEPDSLLMKVTIPKGLFAVSNGRLIERIHNGTKETFVWKTTYPINTYCVTLYIGDFVHFQLPYKTADSLMMLDFYALRNNLDSASKYFSWSLDYLQFMEQQFGPYPFPRDGFKLVESPYAGMENQTAIAIGTNYRKDIYPNYISAKPVNQIILHELCHEWWGNAVTATDFAEIWLHEGFATYCEALYLEKLSGKDAYLKAISYFSILVKNKRPIIGPYDVNYWNYKDGDVYLKGAMVLHTLRKIINDDKLFFKILKEFYQENAYGFVRTIDFIDLVNERTNYDYTNFFNLYLYMRDCPMLYFDFHYDAKSGLYELAYKWAKDYGINELPLQVIVAGKKINLYPSEKLQVFQTLDKIDAVGNYDLLYYRLKRNSDIWFMK